MTRVESATQRKRRLEQARARYRARRDCETPSERIVRLERQRNVRIRQRNTETSEQRDRRSTQTINRCIDYRRSVCFDKFEAAINVLADEVCDICTKRCYPKQVVNFNLSDEPPDYLPLELVQKRHLILCYRCKSHISSKKTIPPSKAYWNNLNPGVIPPEIEVLSQSEQRLIARVNPFIKVVKLSGLFGQFGFKGQAILFAQDIFEITEKLPSLLPRSTESAGIVVITEHLENLSVTRQFSVSREKLIAALTWLIANNPLYKDVIINTQVRLNNNDLIRTLQVHTEERANEEDVNNNNMPLYIPISESSRIIRASWHQGNTVSLLFLFLLILCLEFVIIINYSAI